jgi:serine/threonine protein kinase
MVQALRDASQTLTSSAGVPTPAVSGANLPAAPSLPPVPSSATPVTLIAPAQGYDFLAPAQAPDELGRLGSYRILKMLGGGGMGIVFLAEDVRLKRKVALKAMRPQLVGDQALRKRFLHEARLAALAAENSQEHIVALHQVDEDRGVPFIAMEFLHGENLEECLRRKKKLSIAEALQVGREVATGLAAAHERGLIHRDIKPSNIWLETRPGDSTSASKPAFRVKLLDFGLARDSEAAADHITQTGFVVGTAGYIAPEQARGKNADTRSDLFSLGCVLYECVTGVCPFRGSDPMSRLTALAVEDPISPQLSNPSVSTPFANLILHLLQKAQEDRPQSAREVLKTLEAIEEQAAQPKDASDAGGVPTGEPQPAQVSSAKVILLGLAIVIAVGGIIAMILLRP